MAITNVYVDAFNLYYGALRGTTCKWLDLDALCRRLLPKDQIHRIRYFTAYVSARPGDPQQPRRGCHWPDRRRANRTPWK